MKGRSILLCVLSCHCGLGRDLHGGTQARTPALDIKAEQRVRALVRAILVKSGIFLNFQGHSEKQDFAVEQHILEPLVAMSL